MRRIIVIGTTGSGKTTTARAIAERLGILHVELDALNWGPDWTEVPWEVFRQRVSEAVAGDHWVVNGNYSKSRDIVWPRADAAVWLDFLVGDSLAALPTDDRPHPYTGGTLEREPRAPPHGLPQP